ncbi:tetratricopeptide repeat protein, partial [Lutibacter sp.]|uniref:tetratricopeptide repeat protein n=1 Tax=Lutibacter sp. TaxID=1925666 RepID=UPI0034A09D72
MKYLFLTFSFFFSSILIAPRAQVLNKIDQLNSKIELSEKGKKLQLMDSLGNALNYNPNLNYDSIVKKTIQFALQIDSISIAANNTANLIYFNNSIVDNPEEGLKIFKQFLAKNLIIKNDYTSARFYLNGADSYFFINDHNKALENYKIAETYALKAKDERLLGFVNLYSGQTNESLGDFSKASRNYDKAYNYFLKVKDTFNVLNSKNSLSILYSKNGLFEEAQTERNESISLLKITKNYGQLTSVYYNSALDYDKLGFQDKRISNLLNAFEVNEVSENSKFARPTILNSLAIAYAQNNNILLAEKYLKEIESNSKVFSKEKNSDHYQEAIMNIEFAKGNFKKALTICKNLLSSKINKGNPLEIERFEKFLSLIYEKTGDSENALIHLKNYLSLNDSIKSV